MWSELKGKNVVENDQRKQYKRHYARGNEIMEALLIKRAAARGMSGMIHVDLP